MKKKLFRSFSVLMIVAVIVFGLIVSVIFNYTFGVETRKSITAVTKALSIAVNPDGDLQAQAKSFCLVSPGLRITFINADGTVLADSEADASSMQNHADREEIRLAAESGTGISVRASSTVSKRLIYCAVRCGESGLYLRTSKEFPSFLSNFLSVLPVIVIITALLLCAALPLSRKLAQSISAPLMSLSESLSKVKEGEATLNVNDYPYEELQCMAADINFLSAEIGDSLVKLKKEREKINYILDNMSEGFVLLDADENILICNNSARVFFGCADNVYKKNIVYATRNSDFLEALDKVKQTGMSQYTVFGYSGKYAEAVISPVKPDNDSMPKSGTVICISDITEKRNLEKMRQTFFSNASHELKTPITSIRGFAELLCSDLELPPENRREFCRLIMKETDRVNGLINDIVLINRLESGDVLFEREVLDIGKICEECCRELIPLAKQNDVTLSYSCQSAIYSASRKEMCELFNNLLVNAVKYNKPNGTVDARLEKSADNIVFTVHNTGEEIPPKYQSRIFERFFRIDKGRSRAVGGTGLGLSIVKHIAAQYDAEINLTSTAENGTTVTVTFPQYKVAQG